MNILPSLFLKTLCWINVIIHPGEQSNYCASLLHMVVIVPHCYGRCVELLPSSSLWPQAVVYQVFHWDNSFDKSPKIFITTVNGFILAHTQFSNLNNLSVLAEFNFSTLLYHIYKYTY